MNLIIAKKGDSDIEGLTDGQTAKRLGPKRASKLRKLFGLDKTDDVKKYVVRREVKEGKNKKAPKIQRLVTKLSLQRKRHYRNTLIKKVSENRKEKKAYIDIMHQYREEMKEKRKREVAKKK